MERLLNHLFRTSDLGSILPRVFDLISLERYLAIGTDARRAHTRSLDSYRKAGLGIPRVRFASLLCEGHDPLHCTWLCIGNLIDILRCKYITCSRCSCL